MASSRPPEPRLLRYKLLHVAARITRGQRRVFVRIDAGWPWAQALAAAFARLQALPCRSPDNGIPSRPPTTRNPETPATPPVASPCPHPIHRPGNITTQDQRIISTLLRDRGSDPMPEDEDQIATARIVDAPAASMPCCRAM